MSEIDKYLVNDFKVYVDVIEERTKEGFLRPLSFVWEDNETYTIDKIIDACPGHSLKAGGYGIRYTVEVDSRRIYICFWKKTDGLSQKNSVCFCRRYRYYLAVFLCLAGLGLFLMFSLVSERAVS